MILNGIKLEGSTHANMRRYPTPKLSPNTVFELRYPDTDWITSRSLKRGKYIVLKVRPTNLTKVKGLMTYEFKSVRRNAKRIHDFGTLSIDEAIDLDLIRIVS